MDNELLTMPPDNYLVFGMFAVLGVMLISALVILLFATIMQARIFYKAGRNWGTVFIPVYSAYAYGDIIYGNQGLAWLNVGIPFVTGVLIGTDNLLLSAIGSLASIAYILCVSNVALCKAFGLNSLSDYVLIAIPLLQLIPLCRIAFGTATQYSGAKPCFLHEWFHVTPEDRFMGRWGNKRRQETYTDPSRYQYDSFQ